MIDILIENLTVSLKKNKQNILKNINLKIYEKDKIGIIGESGAGKSTLINSLISFLKDEHFDITGKIEILNKNILEIDYNKRQNYCFQYVSVIPQNSINALNPYETTKEQLLETFLFHNKNINKYDALVKIKNILKDIGFLEIEKVLNSFPNELSGGMKQRIVIALVLCTNTKIIVADEPTTALDPINQFKFIKLLNEICNTKKLTLIYISHDIRLVSDICNKIAILKSGEIIEMDYTENIFFNPKNKYTKKLLNELKFLE